MTHLSKGTLTIHYLHSPLNPTFKENPSILTTLVFVSLPPVNSLFRRINLATKITTTQPPTPGTP